MNIKDMTLELEDELVSMRRHFHMYPALYKSCKDRGYRDNKRKAIQ